MSKYVTEDQIDLLISAIAKEIVDLNKAEHCCTNVNKGPKLLLEAVPVEDTSNPMYIGIEFNGIKYGIPIYPISEMELPIMEID